ncbi:hypothetical protein BCV69DRAFT_299928 [Microstroma glucosiphilum]|uniref:CoA-dependent acyltransferase n=1 Tax=Pseudomicrostroma glucosiphilum TaxID=1684307 RepID=A0A316U9E3_9BASI|nr:hypothetical protein BCV69DRAFT_299928 [Pseudomicrostroma glucosiphilum]PWN19615.1 hypothetical protein BCV69DRAFT_299928 [Pseudomicrostroma glucosiphilum]
MDLSKTDELRRRLQWTRDAGKSRLTRSLISAERSLYTSTQPTGRGYCEFYMVHSVLIKVDAAGGSGDVARFIRQAWRSLYTRIPTLSVLAELSDEGVPVFVYQKDFEQSQEEQWANATFKVHTAEVQSISPECLLQEATAQVCQSACPFNDQGHAFLDATILESDVTKDPTSTVTVALTLRTSHLCFDGTGVWHVMHALLGAMASGAASRRSKETPEPSFLTYLNSDIIEADHSELAQQQIEAMNFPNGHLFGPASMEDAEMSPSMGMSKQRLSTEATASALLRCRQLGVTVSQLLQACFLVAMLEVYPAVETSQIYYDFPINLRDLIPLPKSFYGNAIDVTFNVLPCKPLTDNVRKGRLSTSEDAIAVHRLAQALTSIVIAHRGNAVVETFSLMTAFEALMKQATTSQEDKAPSSVRAPPIVCTADGLLDRHIATLYRGDSLDVQVLDADVMLRRTLSLISGRTYSFDGRLTFLLTFTPGIWPQTKVDKILATSIRNLDFILASDIGDVVQTS